MPESWFAGLPGGELVRALLFLFVPVFFFVFGKSEGISFWHVAPEGRAYQLGAMKRGLIWFCAVGGVVAIASLMSTFVGHTK